jgi:N-acetylglutamate synthase-like GNAT family acetyltransferase
MNNINYAVFGPGGATNNSVRKIAKNIVKGTVRKTYFRHAWQYRNQKQNYAIVNSQGEMVGFALIKKIGDRLEISLIGAKQGKGIGSKLMTQIISNARDRGISLITLDSVPTAAPFYKKFGFITLKEDDEHIIMAKPIISSPVQKPAPRRRTPATKTPGTRRRAATNTKVSATTSRSARTAAATASRTSARRSAILTARAGF